MLNPEIRDRAYQFFIEEAPELLQIIETGLLTLREERSKQKVHEIMRAAHSIKGGAASVELDTIKTLAHRLEDIVKALYDESVEIDTEFESLLLQGYDCLRNPLETQINTGSYDGKAAIATAEPIWQKIEAHLGDSLAQADQYIPSSADLGVDIVSSLFEVDVTQGLEQLAMVATHSDNYDVITELRTQMEVFSGFSEMLGLPGFGEITQATLKALDVSPDQAPYILQLALVDLIQAREQILEKGDRTTGGKPSAALLAFASTGLTNEVTVEETWNDTNVLSFDNLFEENVELLEDSGWREIDTLSSNQLSASVNRIEENNNSVDSFTPEESQEFIELNEQLVINLEESSATTDIDNLEDIFSQIPDHNLEDIFGQISDLDQRNDFAISDSGFMSELTEEKTDDVESLINSETNIEDIFAQLPSQFTEKVETSNSELMTELTEAEREEFVTSEMSASLAEVSSQFPLESISLNSVAQPIEPLDLAHDKSEATKPLTSTTDTPSLDEIFGTLNDALNLENIEKTPIFVPVENELDYPLGIEPDLTELIKTETVVNDDPFIQEVENIFDTLPPITEEKYQLSVPSKTFSDPPVEPLHTVYKSTAFVSSKSVNPSKTTQHKDNQSNSKMIQSEGGALSIKVDFNRLERMNNLVGELAINRNSLSLQNEQMQGSVRSLLDRFNLFQNMTRKLQELSDQMLIAPEKQDSSQVNLTGKSELFLLNTDFDSLEMDTYSNLYALLQNLLEEMIRLEESVDDVVLFARTSNQVLEQQRQMLTNLRDELMWARMLPLGEVLNRFPRILRDLSANYHKPVRLKLTGTGVLVDKAALEKLYDPLLHLLRNAFDHGIEPSEDRQKAGKSEEGHIEIQAYHQGNQTIIEINDDGRGLNLEKIREKASQSGIFTPQQIALFSSEKIKDLIFEPGFSTAVSVSELSGRGVGLDVVRSQLQSLKGTVSVTSKEGKGTTFMLKLPLTLAIAKLLVCFVSYDDNCDVSVAFPSDTIEEIIVPQDDQIKVSNHQRFLCWQRQIMPIYPMKDLLKYNCPLPSLSRKDFNTVPNPEDWGLPLLILRQGQQLYALEVSRLVTEQELVIKPFGSMISAPLYTYGCTILGDGTLIPVVNGTTLIEQYLNPNLNRAISINSLEIEAIAPVFTSSVPQTPLILVVDDSAALRRTLALTLEKAGYRVLQARDGRDALDQLQRTVGIAMVICDIEMPNMNGFEFLGQRRRDLALMKIPVAMLTSRSSDKHQQLAMTLGASAYFTKPYIEQQFLTSVANIIEESIAVSRKS